MQTLVLSSLQHTNYRKEVYFLLHVRDIGRNVCVIFKILSYRSSEETHEF